MTRALVLLAVLLSAPASAHGEPRPGPNDKYLRPDLDVKAWSGRFESKGREIYDKRREIVAATGVRPGSSVADVGAGTGLFTMLFSEAVGPGGKVYAVDIAPKFLAHIKRRAAAAGARNVAVVRGTERSVELPPSSVDVVFVCDTYHHFEHPQQSLASILRALRPGGALVIVDFKREPGKTPAWIIEHVRAGQAAVTAEIKAAGFDEPEVVPVLAESYFLRFRPRSVVK